MGPGSAPVRATPGSMDVNSAEYLINALLDAGVWTADQAEKARAAVSVIKGDPIKLAECFKSSGPLTGYQLRKIRHGRIIDLTVGSFVVLEKIGEGGMGKVYKAISPKIGKPVALKVVRSHLMTNKTVLRRYKREAAAAAALLLTFQHRAGVRPYTSSYDFAEPCVFDKQSPGPLHCGPHYCGRPFSRSYRSILPNSLAMNLSSTLGFSPRLPVSVCGTGTYYLKFRGFSWKPLGALSLCPKAPSTIVFPQAAWICLRSL